MSACHPASPPRQPPPQPYQYEPTPQEKQLATQDFKAFARKFMDWYYAAHPVRATELGIHQGDGLLPDLSREGVQRRISALLDWLQKQEDLEPGLLDMPDQIDFRIIEYAVRAELLDLEEIRVWAHQPGFYLDVIARGVRGLATGDSATRDERMRNVAARLESVPEMLTVARQNLTGVPAPWARVSAADARALAAYTRGQVSAVFDRSNDAGTLLKSQFDGALDRASAALDAYGDWLESSVSSQAGADYHLGRYIFLRDLQYREHVQLSADELDRLSRDAMDDLHAQVQKVAAEIDPGRTPREILDSLARDTAGPEQAVADVRESLASARDFVTSKDLLPLPQTDLPVIRATPAGLPVTFAGLQMRGPLDTVAMPAYLDVPAGMDRTSLRLFVLRAAVPGAFVQRQFADAAESEVRRAFQPRNLREGWDDYAEQLMVDEGFATDDPGLRLVHLRRALERQAGWRAAVRIHAFDASIEDEADGLSGTAYIDPDSALRLVTRATYRPTVFSDALGRLQIIQLRRAYRAYLDAEDETRGTFSLATFHEKFLKLALPATLARLLLMPERRTPGPDFRRGPPLR